MLKIKTIALVCISFFSQHSFAQYTDVINSNRPGESMSAYAIGKSIIQAELGVYAIKEKHDLYKYDANGFGADLVLRYGALRDQLEFIADIQYQMETFNTENVSFKKNNFRQLTLGAKYLLYDPYKNYKKITNIYSYKANHRFDWHQLIPAVSLFAGANYVTQDNPYAFNSNTIVPFANEAGFSPKVTLITQNIFGDGKWVFVTNFTADYITTDYKGYGYTVTLTRGFNDKWSGFIENQGYKSDLYSDAIVRGGAAYLIHSNLQVDASVSSNIKNTPAILYGGLGVSWRYDARFKEKQMSFGKKKDPAKDKKGKGTKGMKGKKASLEPEEELTEEQKIEIDYQELERKRKAKYE